MLLFNLYISASPAAEAPKETLIQSLKRKREEKVKANAARLEEEKARKLEEREASLEQSKELSETREQKISEISKIKASHEQELAELKTERKTKKEAVLQAIKTSIDSAVEAIPNIISTFSNLSKAEGALSQIAADPSRLVSDEEVRQQKELIEKLKEFVALINEKVTATATAFFGEQGSLKEQAQAIKNVKELVEEKLKAGNKILTNEIVSVFSLIQGLGDISGEDLAKEVSKGSALKLDSGKIVLTDTNGNVTEELGSLETISEALDKAMEKTEKAIEDLATYVEDQKAVQEEIEQENARKLAELKATEEKNVSEANTELQKLKALQEAKIAEAKAHHVQAQESLTQLLQSIPKSLNELAKIKAAKGAEVESKVKGYKTSITEILGR